MIKANRSILLQGVKTLKAARIQSLFFFVLLMGLATRSFAQQGELMRTITVKKIERQRLGSILQKISVKGQFSFAYNNQTIPADTLISIDNFQGSIYSFLSLTLGTNYEFQEVPGYIVLRHAPNRMIITYTGDDEKEQQLIKGQVLNMSNMQPVKQVSIYEKNQLISTLTDDRGLFELKLKNQGASITLTATKENFRDTTLFILKQVTVNQKNKTAYKFYPGATANALASGIARLFISSKQRIQNINLGGFFASTPYQLSLTPGLSSHGMYSSQVINHFSLNLIGGYTGGVQGVELAGLFNINQTDVSFLQMAGLFNVVGGNLRGVQVSGLYNQVVKRATGLQLAAINSADELHGVQMGLLFNTAKKVKGLQIAGLLNVADSSDCPVALINFVKNGSKSLSLSYDEAEYTHINFRSGGRILYGLIGIGYNFNHSGRYAYDFGFGAHLVNRHLFTLDSEYAYESLANPKKDRDHINSFRILAGLKLNSRLHIFAAPGINNASYPVDAPLTIHGWQLNKSINGNSVSNLYIGATGGLRFTW